MQILDVVFEFAARLSQRFGLSLGAARLGRLGASADTVPLEEQKLTPMHDAFYGQIGPVVHKWRHYLSVYDHHLAKFRNTRVRVLEIGVSKGGSLCMWREYLGASAILFGVDIDPQCAGFDGQAGQVRIGSQADPAFLRNVVSEMGGIDVVIDDGSHIASHQRISFDVLFPLLAETGTYICEDTHTAYWRGWPEGGFRRRSNFIEFAKGIVDDMHADFHNHAQSVSCAHRLISGVHFYNSVIVIEKAPQISPSHLMVPASALTVHSLPRNPLPLNMKLLKDQGMTDDEPGWGRGIVRSG